MVMIRGLEEACIRWAGRELTKRHLIQGMFAMLAGASTIADLDDTMEKQWSVCLLSIRLRESGSNIGMFSGEDQLAHKHTTTDISLEVEDERLNLD